MTGANQSQRQEAKVRQWTFKRSVRHLTWLRITSCEWISSVTIHAITDRAVIIHSTLGVLTTSIGARIDTFLI